MAFSVYPPGSLMLWVWVVNSEGMGRSADIWGERTQGDDNTSGRHLFPRLSVFAFISLLRNLPWWTYLVIWNLCVCVCVCVYSLKCPKEPTYLLQVGSVLVLPFQSLYLLFSYLDLLHWLELPALFWVRVVIMNILAFFLILGGKIHLFTIKCNVLIFFLLLVLDLFFLSSANFLRKYLRLMTSDFSYFLMYVFSILNFSLSTA